MKPGDARDMTFKDMLQDHNLRQVQEQFEQADGLTSDVMSSLASRIVALQQEVARQNAALTVLTQMLLERGVVDGNALKARFDQLLAANAASANLIACARCRKTVDKRRTQMSGSGPICEACAQAIALDDE
jgi:hypothetical protein